jgi:hypothetical protein
MLNIVLQDDVALQVVWIYCRLSDLCCNDMPMSGAKYITPVEEVDHCDQESLLYVFERVSQVHENGHHIVLLCKL